MLQNSKKPNFIYTLTKLMGLQLLKKVVKILFCTTARILSTVSKKPHSKMHTQLPTLCLIYSEWKKGYESKIALCLLCQRVINANLLNFVKSKKTPHPTPPSTLKPSNTLNQTYTPPARPSFLPCDTQKQTDHY